MPNCAHRARQEIVSFGSGRSPTEGNSSSAKLINESYETNGFSVIMGVFLDCLSTLLAWVGNEWVPVCDPLPIRPFAADSHSTTSHPRAGEATRAQLGPPERLFS
jgi:hypothetical protein